VDGAVTAPTVVLAGRYDLGEPLRRTAFGRVHAARRLADGAPLAVEVLSEAYAADPGVRRRLADGASALTAVSAEHLVPVVDVVVDDGVVAVVRERVGGSSLGAVRAEAGGTLPPREAAGVVVDVLDALADLHVRGVVHGALVERDVLLDQSSPLRPLPLLTGWGTAALLRGRPPVPSDDVADAARLLWQCLRGLPEPPADPPSKLPARLVALLDAMLDPDAAARPTAAQARDRLAEVPGLTRLRALPPATPPARPAPAGALAGGLAALLAEVPAQPGPPPTTPLAASDRGPSGPRTPLRTSGEGAAAGASPDLLAPADLPVPDATSDRGSSGPCTPDLKSRVARESAGAAPASWGRQGPSEEPVDEAQGELGPPGEATRPLWSRVVWDGSVPPGLAAAARRTGARAVRLAAAPLRRGRRLPVRAAAAVAVGLLAAGAVAGVAEVLGLRDDPGPTAPATAVPATGERFAFAELVRADGLVVVRSWSVVGGSLRSEVTVTNPTGRTVGAGLDEVVPRSVTTDPARLLVVPEPSAVLAGPQVLRFDVLLAPGEAFAWRWSVELRDGAAGRLAALARDAEVARLTWEAERRLARAAAAAPAPVADEPVGEEVQAPADEPADGAPVVTAPRRSAAPAPAPRAGGSAAPAPTATSPAPAPTATPPAEPPPGASAEPSAGPSPAASGGPGGT
jgi:hypothetical protein